MECLAAPKWKSHVALGSKSLGGRPSYCLGTVGEIKFLYTKIGYSCVRSIGSCWNTLGSLLMGWLVWFLVPLAWISLGWLCIGCTVKEGRIYFYFPLFLLIHWTYRSFFLAGVFFIACFASANNAEVSTIFLLFMLSLTLSPIGIKSVKICSCSPNMLSK